jgi:uroporphyrinogen decarboxylase
MTPKERLTVAMAGGTPDRVPVTLGLSEMVPVRYSTDDYIEFFWRRQMPLWRARVETEYERFGADAYLHLEEEPSPHDPPVEIVNIAETAEQVRYTRVIHTPKGDLSSDLFLETHTPLSRLTTLVKDPEADAPKVLELLKHPDTKGVTETLAAYDAIGDRAHVGYWLPMPIDWWDSLRGTQDMVMDLYDYPELMEYLFVAYREYAVTLLDRIFRETPLDSLGLGGSSTSMSLISPELHQRYGLEFGRAVCEVAHRYGKPVQYHMCGRSRTALSITVDMGVDGLDALEPPPTGDVDLAEVKRVFGSRVSLKGNVNSITVMLNGTPADVEADVRRCMDAAKAGGGFILSVGDQTPYATPEENMRAFVATGHTLGAYEEYAEARTGYR